MSVVVAVGAQWGDEGKGKVIDVLSEKAKLVVRFSGGDNAGHTIVNPYGKFALQLVPSGIFYPTATCIIANGVAVNPASLIAEMDMLNQRGIATDKLVISDRANMIMPYHVLLDRLEEKARGGGAIGTTGKGIGPVFSDKLARYGIRFGDLLDKQAFRERLSAMLDIKNNLLTKVYGAEPMSLDEIYRQFLDYAERLAPLVQDTTVLIDEAVRRGDNVLLEGAQGTLLDPDFGTYPFGTSSPSVAGQGSVGAGIGPTKIKSVIGVFKAYITRVGEGPMPTILNDAIGQLIRERGHEYGTVSGRPRNVGWFDGVAARYATRVNGLTGAAITKLDNLDVMPAVKVCVAYRLDGKTIDYFPSRITDVARCEPVYEEFAGWQTPLNEVKRFADLPLKARRYLRRLAELIGVPIVLIGVGQERRQTIEVKPVW